MTPDGSNVIRLGIEDPRRIHEVVERRREVPVVRVEKVHSWATADGDLIEEYEHVREYPRDLTFPRIAPGQTTEMRGWRKKRVWRKKKEPSKLNR